MTLSLIADCDCLTIWDVTTAIGSALLFLAAGYGARAAYMDIFKRS